MIGLQIIMGQTVVLSLLGQSFNPEKDRAYSEDAKK